MPVDALADHEPPGSVAVGAYDGARLVGVGLVGPDGGPGAWRIRGMATEPAARGQGAGTAVLAALIEYAGAHGASRIWCNARVRARTLYERAGLRAISVEFDVPRIGPHYVMELVLTSSR